MRVKQLFVTVFTLTFGLCALQLQANNGGNNTIRQSNNPENAYWKAPNWSVFSVPPSSKPAQSDSKPPVYSNRYQRPPALNRPPYSASNTPAPGRHRPVRPAANTDYPPSPRGPYRDRDYRSRDNRSMSHRSMPHHSRSHRSMPYGNDNRAPAFKPPGSHRYYSNQNYDRVRRRSGPGPWMNSDKR